MGIYGFSGEDRADPRTDQWFMMRNSSSVLGLIFIYLCVIHIGSKLMENYKPFRMKAVLLLYNAVLVILSLYTFKEAFVSSYLSNYSYTCQPVDYTLNPLSIRMAGALWWFFFLKVIELLDTVFIILRKKSDQITFLHVYHHCTMLCIWWVAAKYVPGGETFIAVLVNCIVHTIMYTYYGLSVLGDRVKPYLWWKRYLTQIQMIQFLIVAGHACFGLYHRCPFPGWMFFWGVVYLITLFALFANFYIKTYFRKQEKAKEPKPIKSQ